MTDTRLVIIGGAEDKTRDRTVLREFIRMAGQESSRIAVVPAGSSYPEQVGLEYEAAF
jgi:cyanophycinase